jgi:hypothetical protein
MKYKALLTIPVAILFFLLRVQAQDKSNVKFGKVSPEDFATKVYSIDSSVDAVIIADIGATEFVGNMKGWFSLQFKQYRRVHILKKNGYDIADIEIPLYDNGQGGEEKLDKLKAVTYNLENGKVVETKLDTKSGVFKDKVDKNWTVRKFTFPNIKEGSIIEYEYTITSDFLFNLHPWEFQGKYPRLWSEYEVSIPQFFGYIFLSQGYRTFDVRTSKGRTASFSVTVDNGTQASDRYDFSSNVTDYRWVMKNVPPLKEESYTSTLNNHVAKISFQLSERRDPLTPYTYMTSWPKASSDLLKDEDFGGQLSKDNGWLNDVMSEASKGSKDDLEKAKNIYAYVRDHFTCTRNSGLFLRNTLRNVLKARNGTVAEINLLLVAMLRKANLNAEPVILSTRTHGFTYELYPVMEKFNYVVIRLNIKGQQYYLDASRPRLGFGRLPYECYNGHARVVNEYATPVYFHADSLMEAEITSVLLINDQNGKMIGSVQHTPGYISSHSIREDVKEKGEEAFFANLKKGFNTEIGITKKWIDSLDKFEEPVKVTYEFDLSTDHEDIIYFNPILAGSNWKDNPFKSAERFYPVEMPYAIDETYLLRMDIPAGYEVDELPKQIMVRLNEQGDGLFEYRISQSNGSISLRSRIRVSRAYFLPEEYEILREFFNLVVKKHSEQIVFKKKS